MPQSPGQGIALVIRALPPTASWVTPLSLPSDVLKGHNAEIIGVALSRNDVAPLNPTPFDE